MEEVDEIDITLDRKKWQPLANKVMKIRAP
jgi:hypothetical protein